MSCDSIISLKMAIPFVIVVLILITKQISGQYQPTWESLDNRSLPTWYDDSKFGIFMHWGVFSVPSFKSEWFWYYWQSENNVTEDVVQFMQNNYCPGFTYADFAPEFKAEFFDADHWADIVNSSGAKYFVLTSKHHEGYTLWPSNSSWNWNAMDVGPHRDLVGELASAIRNRTDIRFGLYHSLYEWFNRMYLADKAAGFTTQNFVKTKTMPELYDLVEKYKPEVIWSDGDWEASSDYWDAKNFLAWLYNDSPVKDVVVTNDRWGNETRMRHGGYYSGPDRYDPGKLVGHKWENAMTLDQKSWGYRREMTAENVLTMDDITKLFAETISCGGNLLMNIGPTKEGTIIPIFEERLRQTGAWLKVNGEGIYGSKPWIRQNDTITTGVWYTSKQQADGSTTVYAIVLDWPKNNLLYLGAPTPYSTNIVHLLGYEPALSWRLGPGTLGIDIDVNIPVDLIPCKWAWVFKMTAVYVGSTKDIPLTENHETGYTRQFNPKLVKTNLLIM